MTKNYYILLLLICFSLINTSKTSPKNLRNLATNYQATISEATKLKNEEGQLSFAISLDNTDGLEEGQKYNIIILDKDGEKTVECTYSDSKFTCGYSFANYYGRILVKKQKISLADGDTFEIKNDLKLQQTVELTFDKAFVKYASGTATGNYYLQIYVTDGNIVAGSYYQVDILLNSKSDILNCTYTITTDPLEKYLNCQTIGNQYNLIQLAETQTSGSIKWKKDDSVNFEKDVLFKFEVEGIYGYNLQVKDNQWVFYTHVKKLNVEKEGYYYTINVLINKASGTEDISKTALCKTINYHSECTIQSNIEASELEQESNYLFYLSNDQSDSYISVKDNSLSQKKIISRVITLEFVKAYELKYEDRIWKFKIEISNEGLREGLNVTVDLYNNPYYYTGSCVHSNKILSCEKDNNIGQNELIYLVFQKKSGSVTWSNKDASSPNIKMALDRILTYQKSFYLKYDETNQKWTFKLVVSDSALLIPGDSLITVDILYDTNKNALAQCEGNNSTSTGYYQATFTCECKLEESQIPQISKDRVSGSVTLNGLTSSASIARKIEFTLVKAYNMVFSSNDKTWSFDIDFEDTEKINPSSTTKYSLDIYYDTLTSGTRLFHVIAECSLKGGYQNIFSCTAKFNNVNAVKYILYVINPAFSVGADFINWIGGVTDKYQIALKTELTFEKGILSYESTSWALNIEISGLNSNISANSKLFLDVKKNEAEEALECIITSRTSLKCDTKISDTSVETLPSFSLNRLNSQDSSGVIWKNTQSSDFYLFYLVATLSYQSADKMSFTNNRWQFNLLTSGFPAKSKIIIDILYDSDSSTATCVKEILNTKCTVDKTTQSQNANVKLNHVKSSGSTITWSNLYDPHEIGMLLESDIKQLEFKKAYDLTINSNNNWEFKVDLETSTLKTSDNQVEIDIKFNEDLDKALCTITSSTLLTCTKEKRSSHDRIKITNNEENVGLKWENLDEDVELFVLYNIKFINSYGGFHENKWKFNLKYERSTGNTIDVNNNYALLDIKVNNAANMAKCKITENFLLCESQHASQSNDDKIEIEGTKNKGTITISSGLSSDKKTFQPMSIKMEYTEYSDYSYSNNFIKFNIKGKLKDNEETEIPEGTITGVQLLITKKDSTGDINAICLLNENEGNDSPVVLSCEATGTVNEEDDVDIKVDSDGKSNYVTFSSSKANINIHKHSEKTEAPSEDKTTTDKTTQNNNGLMTKFSYVFLFVLILLF